MRYKYMKFTLAQFNDPKNASIWEQYNIIAANITSTYVYVVLELRSWER